MVGVNGSSWLEYVGYFHRQRTYQWSYWFLDYQILKLGVDSPNSGKHFIKYYRFIFLNNLIKIMQAKWLAENFGPTLRNSKYKNILIMGPEDQRIVLPNWLDIVSILFSE